MYLKSSIQTSSIDYNIHITLNISSNIPFQYIKNIITNTEIHDTYMYTSK